MKHKKKKRSCLAGFLDERHLDTQLQWFSLSYAGWESGLLDCNCISLRGNCFVSLPETQSSFICQIFFRKLCVSSVMYSPLFSSFTLSVTKGYRWCNLTMFVKAVLQTHAESYSGMQMIMERHQEAYFYLWASFYNFHLCGENPLDWKLAWRLWHEITFKTLLILYESTLPHFIQLMRQIICYLGTAFFSISPRQIKHVSPLQKIFCWAALKTVKLRTTG